MEGTLKIDSVISGNPRGGKKFRIAWREPFPEGVTEDMVQSVYGVNKSTKCFLKNAIEKYNSNLASDGSRDA